MPDTCETVVIETENGPVIINKSDLTKDHVLFNDEPKQTSKKKQSKKDK